MDCVLEDINDDSYDEDGNETIEEETRRALRTEIDEDQSSSLYMTFSPVTAKDESSNNQTHQQRIELLESRNDFYQDSSLSYSSQQVNPSQEDIQQ